MLNTSLKFNEPAKSIKAFSFAEIKEPKEKISVIQVLKTGSFSHAVYGKFEITKETLKEFKENFDKKVRGIDLVVDENHDPHHKAVGFFKDLTIKGNKLFATIEWNKTGVQLIKDKIYKYFSPELHFSYQDEETGETINNVLVGGGITNRPYFKGMEALKMHEVNQTPANNKEFYYINNGTMTFKELVDKIKAKGSYTFAEMEALRLSFSELPETEQVENEAAVAEVEKLPETTEEEKGTETKPDEKDPKEGTKKTEGEEKDPETKKTEEKEGDEKDPETKPVEVKTFSEDETKAKEFNEALKTETGMTFAEVKEMQAAFSKQANELKAKEFGEKLESLVFSDDNQAGIINPAKKDKVLGFAMKLSDNLAKEFFEILPDSIKTFQFGEIGKTGTETKALNFSIPDKTPEGVDRESYVLAEATKLFSELPIDEAMLKAQAFIKKNNIK